MNLIYQYWTGRKVPMAAQSSSTEMKAYAERIGAEYRFDTNPKISWDKIPHRPWYFAGLSLIFDDSFDKYDNILFADADIFPVSNNIENIFDLNVKHVGMVEEKGALRWKHTKSPDHAKEDYEWTAFIESAYGISLPRSPEGWPLIFNSGVVFWTKEGRQLARKLFEKPSVYQNKIPWPFYKLDQNYLITMVHAYSEFELTILPDCWNCPVGHNGIYDARTAESKLVHIQLPGKRDFSYEKCMEIAHDLPKN